jgi:copper chaperone CopZ
VKFRFLVPILSLILFSSVLILAGDEKPSGPSTALLNIKGMTSDGCASQVKSALSSVSGVKECQVDWKSGKAEVRFVGDETKAQELLGALKSTPFQASLANVTLASVSSKPAAGATSATNQPNATKVTKSKFFQGVSYQCAHCQYSQNEPGKCPTCKAELAKAESSHTFACSKDGYISGEAGKCPKCNADLLEYEVTFKCPTCQKMFAVPGKCADDKIALRAVVGQEVKKMQKTEKSEPAKTM